MTGNPKEYDGMARQAKPWYWTARKGWYVEIAGKQVLLGKAPAKSPTPPAPVRKEFFRLMAAEGRLDPRQKDNITVADAAEAYLASRSSVNRPRTCEAQTHRLGPFVAHFGARRLDSLRPDEVIAFAAAYKGRNYLNRTFNEPGRYLLFRSVKTLFRWARDTGLVALNPFTQTANPWVMRGRTRGITPDEFGTLMADPVLSRQFKVVLDVAYRTGARPGEIACLRARHLDAKLPIARLKPHEYKTGGKTGLPREIIFPPDLMGMLRAEAGDRPEGQLLRNAKGNPWTAASISQSFRYARLRNKLPGDLVMYMTRHGFITRLLDEGHNPVIVAKLAGHTHAETIQRTYYHPDTMKMIEAVGGEDGLREARAAEVRNRVEQERLKAGRARTPTD